MSPDPRRPELLGYDIRLDEAARRIWVRRRRLIAFVCGGLACGLLYLHAASYTYTAELMVSPVRSSAAGNLNSKLGSLGSLAGINLDGGADTQDFQLYQAGIFSRDVADALAGDPEIMRIAFRGQWDAATKSWRRPGAVTSALRDVFKSVMGTPIVPWQPPNGAALQDYIGSHIQVAVDPKRPIVTIAYDDEDPAAAVLFLTRLDRAVDRKLRDNAWARASQYSRYLSTQLEKVTNADIRDALMSSLTDQEKIKMMASATAPYAAQPFGQPSASSRPTSPRPMAVILLALVLGALAGCASVFAPSRRGRTGK